MGLDSKDPKKKSNEPLLVYSFEVHAEFNEKMRENC